VTDDTYMRNVGAAPLQRHPVVAVALVCVSVQIRAARVAQTNTGQILTDPISPLRFGQKVPLSAKKSLSCIQLAGACVSLELRKTTADDR
jgi:hypothetical protein